MMLGMPRAEGLFRRAIVQSGGAYPVMSSAGGEGLCRLLAGQLGVEATREAIAAVPVDRTLQAQAKLRTDLMAHPDPGRWGREVMASMTLWQPVIDGDVIPASPLDRIATGVGAMIDLLAGSNVDESRFFMVPGGAIDRISPEMLAGALAAYGLPVEATLAGYGAQQPGAGPGELLTAIQGDQYFRIPNMRLADAHATSSAATYMYEFAWRSQQFNGRLGACHGLEIGFVFDVIGTGDDPLLGSNPPRQLAGKMHTAWVAFATNGECPWPKYDLSRRATMRFDATPEVVYDPRAAERALWAGVR